MVNVSLLLVSVHQSWENSVFSVHQLIVLTTQGLPWSVDAHLAPDTCGATRMKEGCGLVEETDY